MKKTRHAKTFSSQRFTGITQFQSNGNHILIRSRTSLQVKNVVGHMKEPITLRLVTTYNDLKDIHVDLIISVTALNVNHPSFKLEPHNLLQVAYTVRQDNLNLEDNIQRVQLSLDSEGWKIQIISIDCNPPGFLDWLKQSVIELYDV